MEFNVDQVFKLLEITNGHFRPYNTATKTYGASKELGCTGKLSMQPEMKTITMRCEGRDADEVSKAQFYTVTLTGHILISVLRDIFGLTNEGLEPGVYAVGKNSKPKKGSFTWEANDMYGDIKKYIAIPNMAVVSGYAFEHENGGDEIAEIEIEFKAMADTEGNFYYEAFEGEGLSTEIKTKWINEFEPTLVKKVVTP